MVTVVVVAALDFVEHSDRSEKMRKKDGRAMRSVTLTCHPDPRHPALQMGSYFGMH
eukprot:CAMPEP_0119321564 /NCGR_PEP_ID=MMETSP1333-20130426/55736_1 /TAXON_ID=418940 /ORGANISM="Scyphosphaera apsteinii, Strain RCC1455" /LENGTH=55 /DNA_ID=CAMNT_0007328567 /DNA_START=77 /DNA_END=241 /DNA_ORIENTATION=-